MKPVAVVTGVAHPMSGYIVKALVELGCPPACVVIDVGRRWSEKDLAIHAERTAGRLPALSVEDLGGAVDLVCVENHNGPETVAALKQRGCTLVVNAGTPRILQPALLNSVDAVLNCHPGVLPSYRGCSCVEWAIFNDDPVGNTVHLMTAGIDEGPIVACETVPLSTDDDYPAARVRVFLAGFALLATSAFRLANGIIDLSVLSPQGPGRYWKPIDSESMNLVVQKLAEGRYRFQSPHLGRHNRCTP